MILLINMNLSEKLRSYLNIAENQHKKIIKNYTYDIVIKNLLEYCKY